MIDTGLYKKTFRHENPAIPRYAEVCAEFYHENGGQNMMVTWYQTSDFDNEEPRYYTDTRKNFISWFPTEI